MPDYYLGEIRAFATHQVPQGWELCNGKTYAVQYNQALYALIGGTYGEDKAAGTFNLPNLNGRVAVSSGESRHSGLTYLHGAQGGAETVGMIANQMPPHTHPFNALSTAGTRAITLDAVASATSPAANTPAAPYVYGPPSTPPVGLESSMVINSDGGVPHPNMQPFVVVNYYIATGGGIFPSKT